LHFAHTLLRGPSAWSVGERELFVRRRRSRANSCAFCVGTHGEIAARELGRDVLARLDEGTLGARAAAAAVFVEALTRDPNSISAADVERARVAGADDDALAEDRRRGAEMLRRGGYRLPGFLLR
jgi:AhpD family alkylhydroperoxidase